MECCKRQPPQPPEERFHEPLRKSLAPSRTPAAESTTGTTPNEAGGRRVAEGEGGDLEYGVARSAGT
jgi:hypothetical protein